MADGFVQKVAELEQALARVESSMHGAELERARALVAALLEVHRVALLDLRRVLGDTELSRIAAVEPSLAWLLACHEISSAELERALAVAEAKKRAPRQRLPEQRLRTHHPTHAQPREPGRMSVEAARRLAHALMFEGYVLYPYRKSSLKNQKRLLFGSLCPAVWGERSGERSGVVCEVLVRGEQIRVEALLLQWSKREATGEADWREADARTVPAGPFALAALSVTPEVC